MSSSFLLPMFPGAAYNIRNDIFVRTNMALIILDAGHGGA